MSKPMSFETASILRHIAVHGTRTRPEVAKAFPGNTRIDATISNLTYLGYLASDHNTSPAQYCVTGKGRKRLLTNVKPGPNPAPASAPVEVVPPPLKAQYSPRPTTYRASEFAPSHRPGAMVAFGLPSRFGETLRWRDGRVTDMAGNPIND